MINAVQLSLKLTTFAIMRTFHTPLLFSNDGPPLKNVRITADMGRIVSICQGDREAGDEDAGGVIVPGFVNAHTHLELSHLKGLIPRGCGMAGFIRALMKTRFQADEKVRLRYIEAADREMWESGIVAAGDISNEGITASVKEKSPLRYHTFLELTGLSDDKAASVVLKAKSLLPLFNVNARNSAGLTLHAPYSFTPGLLRQCLLHASLQVPLSIHMQESEDELQFYSTGDGPIAEVLKEAGIQFSDFIPSPGHRPLLSILPLFPHHIRLQLVHNTFTTESEIAGAADIHPHLYWCLCPRANQYITGKLPDVSALRRQKVRITIGTDSLASNSSLSVLSELLLLSSSYREVSFDELICWSSLNGALLLGMEEQIGRIRPGMSPGLISLTGLNTENPVLHAGVEVRRLA